MKPHAYKKPKNQDHRKQNVPPPSVPAAFKEAAEELDFRIIRVAQQSKGSKGAYAIVSDPEGGEHNISMKGDRGTITSRLTKLLVLQNS